MRIVLFFCLCCCLHAEGYTQWLPPSLRTKDNGLPSNVVYQSISDHQGFLWLATDQGVARYDGKQVQVYAREQGVPDIEVMQLEVDHFGRIWIRC
jgi:ligand-binding sensor domain-containing protein